MTVTDKEHCGMCVRCGILAWPSDILWIDSDVTHIHTGAFRSRSVLRQGAPIQTVVTEGWTYIAQMRPCLHTMEEALGAYLSPQYWEGRGKRLGNSRPSSESEASLSQTMRLDAIFITNTTSSCDPHSYLKKKKAEVKVKPERSHFVLSQPQRSTVRTPDSHLLQTHCVGNVGLCLIKKICVYRLI